MQTSGVPNNDTSFPSSDGYGHPADKMFSLYLKEAEKVDRQMVENWKGTTDGILIFSGLFSAVVTAFLIESYKDLSEDTDTDGATVALLAQISSQLAAIYNSSHALNVDPPPPKGAFHPSTAILAVNAMWFLSLSLSLICALAATLVQYWARDYTRSVERFQQSSHKRALIRALMFEGLEKSHVNEIVDAIPTLIHVALFLFLTGLVIFLHKISLPIAYFVLATLMACALMYAVTAALPLFHIQSTLRTPFSSALWYIWHYCARIFYSPELDTGDIGVAVSCNMPRTNDTEERIYIRFLESKFVGDGPTSSMTQTPPSAARKQRATISISQSQEKVASVNGRLRHATKKRMVRALAWIHGLASEDCALEAFIMAIPGLSLWEPSLLNYLIEHDPQLLADIRRLFHRTILYPWALGERNQKTRVNACMEAMYSLTGAVSSPIDQSLMWKIYRAPLLFVSDLLPYLQYCDKDEISLVFCTMTACLNLREPTLATTTRELVFYPELSRARQYIDKLLEFNGPEGHLGSTHDTSTKPRPLSPFEYVICTTLPELSRTADRVSAYKHILNIFEAVWQSVQEPRARFHQSTFVNFLEKLLVDYSCNSKEPVQVLTASAGVISNTLTNMFKTLLEATRSLDDVTAIIKAISALTRYIHSNPTYCVTKACITLEGLERKMRFSTNGGAPSQTGDLPIAL